MGGGGADQSRSADELVRLQMLLRAHMTHGHLCANIDPLKLAEHYRDSPTLAEKFRFPDQKLNDLLNPATYGFTEADMEREFYIHMPMQSTIVKRKPKWKLRDVLDAYKQAYCG